MRKQSIILALETGIGGSVSLFRDSREIDFWKAGSNLSRAEDLLESISNLLRKNRIRNEELKTIFVSKGPGNYTGLRIGIATAKGLQKALNCRCCGVNVLESIILKAGANKRVGAALSLGENQIWREIFEFETSGGFFFVRKPDKISIEQLIGEIDNGEASEWILDEKLSASACRIIPDFGAKRALVTEVSEPLSRYVGLRGMQSSNCGEIFPVYY